MWKSNLEETKQRYINWWNHKGIIVNMWEHFQNGVKPHADIPEPKAPKDLNQKWFDPEWRAEYLDWYVAHSSLKADMLPVANTQLGPGSLAAILGGVFEGGEDTIWIHPDPNYSDELKFNPEHPNYLLHKELLKACKKKANGNYFVGMPDLMEGMDVLAALKGTDKVLMDTVTQPEVLERQMQQINDIYFKVFDELYDIIREGDEMAFCYFSSWAPGKMSKLQSDISTMISVEDYRRFVQPFIREQCQKIDYTLYHLDGVGAMHHLPALLEIEELNAIQWTPGVGEPQGGSPKWYDLYKKILAGGKSIMACWVTLDELRPLLDNIGGNGVHLEMDFHNEDEVEKALRIVEEYQEDEAKKEDNDDETIRISSNKDDADREVEAIINKVEAAFKERYADGSQDAKPTPMQSPIKDIAKERIIVLDGAMGTMIQSYKLGEDDFRGKRFSTHPVSVKGCNDLLCLTRPDVIEDIHRRYLEAGVDLIETNTFNAQRISMADYRLDSICREINLEACKIARKAADEYTRKTPDKPRFVVGSVGPTNKTCSIASDTTQPGWQPFNYSTLTDAYTEQIEALVDGGVDAVLIETIFDTLNAKAAIESARGVFRKKGKQLPIMLSFTVSGSKGYNMLGQSVEEFIAENGGDDILSVGVNCCSDINEVLPLLGRLGKKTNYLISAYPNAGYPDKDGHYALTPEMMQKTMWQIVERHQLNIMGGCCGTTDGHIRKMAELVEPIKGLFLSPHSTDHSVDEGSVAEVTAAEEAVSESAKEPKKAYVIPNDALEKPKEEPKEPAFSVDLIYEAILAGKSDDAKDATQKAIDQGVAPQDIINGQMIRAMGEVGRRFQDGKAFVPQLLMAGRAMKAALELLKPMLAGSASTTIGRVVIGTVKGDLHDIGKNLVASMLEGCGFEVINIGIDVSCDKFVEAVKENNADILCMSALLTTTMTYMKDVIDALEEAGIRDKVKVMVGGAPVTQGFANEIGADGYSDNANSAVGVAKELLGKS
ncbi:MAG: homocysteine S-methyltransferase family protein [Prevotellaceae bacterium]|nr:homocysteine S-methyltransferase family protein [Prevotellaceae bacterium]